MRSSWPRAVMAVAAMLLVAVPAPGSSPPSPQTSSPAAVSSAAATDGRLEIRLELLNDTMLDRVPMRTARLHFRNLSPDPLRLYLPQAEAFRAMISTISFTPRHGNRLRVPEPRPHGYVITEVDFPRLAPGESRTFTQRFMIDPMVRGPGVATHRLPGFEAGQRVSVTWDYENKITRWQGGLQTLDGPKRTLFEGRPIPHIWTGKLSTKLLWTVPKE